MSTQNSTHAAVAALRLYEAAHEDLFVQCCSNPIKNAWGKEVNLTKLNIAHEAAGRALNASSALEAPAAQDLPADEFRGDTPSLVRNIIALLEFDAEGALVPHGIGGHARGLLSAAAARLAAAPQAPAAPGGDEREAFEAWIKKDGGDLSTFGSGQNRHYNNSGVDNAWTGWTSRAALAAPAVPEDPMDWPLPCDVTVGHGTIRKGCKLRTLVLRMQALYNLAQETELAAPAAPAAPAVDAMWPLPGDLVRYGEGVTALALLGAPHARGWHSEQCMGGHLYHTDAYRPTDTDRRMWAACAVEWRGKTMAEARREAGLPPFPLVNPIPQAKPEC
ncbi:hypothetical protein [Delftia tsuruhatensis]|uniref:hypothetical protein n=1 Tax=Delftia tsuruhatensis TaxID=180282 RepID=UPI0007738E96|nr:hypothetical protein [Delftia tsuruhatensis]SFB50782.1 hypothetical protein SAMN05444579_107251 [Delftia tsuruhatensis]